MRWVVFNVVVHNADAHAEDLSLVGPPGQRQSFALFYDLVCTGAYGSAPDHRLAMRVGDQFDPGLIARNSWRDFAKAVGIGARQITDTVREPRSGRPDGVRDAARELRLKVGSVPRLQQLQTTVTKSAKKTLELLDS